MPENLHIEICSCGLKIYNDKYNTFSSYHKKTDLHRERIRLFNKNNITKQFHNNKRILETTTEDNLLSKKIKWIEYELNGDELEPLPIDFIRLLEDEDINL